MPTAAHDYRIDLDAYAGPLDLLLYLVKRHEIDLNDIPIAKLTDQYLAHLEVLKLIDVDGAGEFLVMAAALVEIKSQMLIPRLGVERDDDAEGASAEGEAAEGGVGVDPRAELVQQLLAYKRFKDAAIELEEREQQWASRFTVRARMGSAKPQASDAGADQDDAAAGEISLDLEDVSILDLCEAFGRILDTIGQPTTHDVTYDDTPISLHAADIYDRLTRLPTEERRDGLTLRQLFEGRRTRGEMIGLFLATLELVRQRKVRVVQQQPSVGGEKAAAGEDIRLEARPESEHVDASALPDEESVDWRDSHTGEMRYDWPDEASRRRYERRQALREREHGEADEQE